MELEKFVKVDKNIVNDIFNNLSLDKERQLNYVNEKMGVKRTVASLEPLSVLDEDILYTLLFLSHREFLKARNDSNMYEKIYEKRDSNHFFDCERIKITTSFYELYKKSSLSSKNKYKEKIRLSLRKLSKVNYSVMDDNGNETSGSFIDLNILAKENIIEICIFESFVDSFSRNYSEININDRSKIGLQRKKCLKLFNYFSSFIDKNKTQKIYADTIINKIIGDVNEMTSKQLSKYRDDLKKDIDFIDKNTYEFSCEKFGRGKESYYLITRSK